MTQDHDPFDKVIAVVRERASHAQREASRLDADFSLFRDGLHNEFASVIYEAMNKLAIAGFSAELTDIQKSSTVWGAMFFVKSSFNLVDGAAAQLQVTLLKDGHFRLHAREAYPFEQSIALAAPNRKALLASAYADYLAQFAASALAAP